MFCLKGGIDAKFFEVLPRPLFAWRFAFIWLVVVIEFLWRGGDVLIGWTRTGTGFVNDNVDADGGEDDGDEIGGTSSESTIFKLDIEVEKFCNICGCVGSIKRKYMEWYKIEYFIHNTYKFYINNSCNIGVKEKDRYRKFLF